jgi:hypothetical protein
MKSSKTILFAILLLSCQLIWGQQTGKSWEKWNHLIGEWVGEGNGQPGSGEGTFSFKTDLDGKILVRRNHTAFPATTNSPATVHDDLLIVYSESPAGSPEAIYFDNEGNTIKYKISFPENAVVFTSDISPKAPRFRLTYQTIDNKTVNIIFEMASPQSPEKFKTYLSGRAFKVK